MEEKGTNQQERSLAIGTPGVRPKGRSQKEHSSYWERRYTSHHLCINGPTITIVWEATERKKMGWSNTQNEWGETEKMNHHKIDEKDKSYDGIEFGGESGWSWDSRGWETWGGFGRGIRARRIITMMTIYPHMLIVLVVSCNTLFIQRVRNPNPHHHHRHL